MSDTSRENLSCLMDDELDRRGRKFLLRRLAGDAELTATWTRMHTVRACLQGESLAGADLVNRVAAALQSEAAPVPSAKGWLRPITGTAIAASVALMAVVGFNSLLEQQGSLPAGDDQAGFVARSTSFDQPFTQPTVPVSYSENQRAERERISGYVLRHHQAAGNAGFPTWVPIVTGLGEELDTPPDVVIYTPVFDER